MSEQLWTLIVRCGTCGCEINRADHVPEAKRLGVSFQAPLISFCSVPSHNSLSDVNWNYDAEWVTEPEMEGNV